MNFYMVDEIFNWNIEHEIYLILLYNNFLYNDFMKSKID